MLHPFNTLFQSPSNTFQLSQIPFTSPVIQCSVHLSGLFPHSGFCANPPDDWSQGRIVRYYIFFLQGGVQMFFLLIFLEGGSNKFFRNTVQKKYIVTCFFSCGMVQQYFDGTVRVARLDTLSKPFISGNKFLPLYPFPLPLLLIF